MSIMQEEKRCYITGDTENLHKHHVFQGSRRKASDKWGCWIWLRYDWHNCSDYCIHKDKELDRQIKQECQRKFEALYGHEKFIEVFGKNYLGDENEKCYPQIN